MGKHLNSEQLEVKLKELIESKEVELNITVIKIVRDGDKNAVILAKRHFDDTHIVWSSYYTGEERTSYVNFYSGSYDLTLTRALDETQRRVNL